MQQSTRTKICSRCETAKALESFHRMNASPDGYQYNCSDCLNEARRKRLAQPLGSRAKANRAAAQNLAASGAKVCASCQHAKPLTKFQRHSDSLDGFHRLCKDCRRAAKAAAYLANREATLERNRAYYEAHREKSIKAVLAWQALNTEKRRDYEGRRRARKRATSVGPVDMEALWSGRCGICTEAIDSDLRSPHPMSRSLDHVIPLSLGGSHEQSNLQWSHLRCNIRKGARPTT